MTLESIFTEVFSVPRDRVNDSLALGEIPSWDSMSHMILIGRVEETFRVEFTGDEIADFRTFGDVRKALDQRGVT
jgi:acyl carrier protein